MSSYTKFKTNCKLYFIREYSTDVGDPYYPVPNQRNRDLYKKYQVRHYLRLIIINLNNFIT
jgi:UDP-galactopyranose mutase